MSEPVVVILLAIAAGATTFVLHMWFPAVARRMWEKPIPAMAATWRLNRMRGEPPRNGLELWASFLCTTPDRVWWIIHGSSLSVGLALLLGGTAALIWLSLAAS
jgi:hypothetical protein